MLIKVKNDGREELLLVNPANFKKRNLKHLSLSPVERTLNKVTSKVQYNIGNYSLYAAANGGVASGFVLVGGLPSTLLLLTLGLVGLGGAGLTYSLRYGKRANKRYAKAMQRAADRDSAIRIERYSQRALNSYAFNALMNTDFGRKVLKPKLFSEYVAGTEDLSGYLAKPKSGALHEILMPKLHEYLALMSFVDCELERLREEQPEVVRDAETEIDKSAAAWVVENMKRPYDDYVAEQKVLAETNREMTLDYFKGLLPGVEGWDA